MSKGFRSRKKRTTQLNIVVFVDGKNRQNLLELRESVSLWKNRLLTGIFQTQGLGR